VAKWSTLPWMTMARQLPNVFMSVCANPLLTDISVDWNGLRSPMFTEAHSGLFGAKPVILSGRYTPAVMA